jgi:hypothetical protein
VTFEQRKPPGPTTEGIPKTHHSHHEEATSSIAERREFFAQQLHGIYVVVAQVKSPGPEPRYRRRFYAGLAAAQRHVDRCRQDGKDAYLFIGQLHIVDGDAR